MLLCAFIFHKNINNPTRFLLQLEPPRPHTTRTCCHTHQDNLETGLRRKWEQNTAPTSSRMISSAARPRGLLPRAYDCPEDRLRLRTRCILCAEVVRPHWRPLACTYFVVSQVDCQLTPTDCVSLFLQSHGATARVDKGRHCCAPS